MKSKTPAPLFSCTKCDAQLLKWAGQCPECQAWGTVKQVEATQMHSTTLSIKAGKPSSFAGLNVAERAATHPTNFAFLDRMLSGGLVTGSVSLLGGEPGIGKSTLLAQLCLAWAKQGKHVLYITGEESPQQVLLRLQRLQTPIPPTLEWLDNTQADTIAATLLEKKPDLTIIDSVQTLRAPGIPGEPGNPTQVKASAALISEAAKKSSSTVIFVGQVTKDGDLAGPRLLEHLVDTVMMLEGDRYQLYRLLRMIKHRFGTTEESAILSMNENGLQEVVDPSAAFIADRPQAVPGSIITCLCEGTRPLLVEIQALVSPAGFSTPARRASGIDQNRLNLILAVLAKRAGLGFGDQDVFVNAVGGVDAKDPSIDLAIALALASAKLDKAISASSASWGELGLAGELRPVTRPSLREKEAIRLGLTTLVTPTKTLKTLRDALHTAGLK